MQDFQPKNAKECHSKALLKECKKKNRLEEKMKKKRERTGGSRTSLNAIDSQGDSPAE